MQQPYERRLFSLRSLLAYHQLDGIIIASPANIYYYSGFSGEDSWLFIGRSAIGLLTDGRYTEQAAKECPEVPVFCQGGNHGNWVTLLAEICQQENIQKLAFEGAVFTFQQFVEMRDGLNPNEKQQVLLYDAKELLLQGRLIKEEEELECLRKVAAIGDDVMKMIEKYLRPGITEKEIAREIDYAFLSLGAERTSFPTIVAAGKNGAKPHAKPSDYLLKAGDLVTMDFGGVYQGYCGDMTRTVAIGYADEKQKELYQLVLQAQTYAVANLRAGMTTHEADALARDIIADAGYGEYFSHSLGHGVGLEIHEHPFVRKNGQEVLAVGQVVTVEPGIYIPDWGGIRIEDTVVITEKGAVPFNHYPKQLRCFS